MVDNPAIANYKKFYIQVGTNTLYDTKEQWGFIAKSNPYPALPSPKTPYKNDWKDANGDDEYTTHLYYEAFSFDVSFYIRTKNEDGKTAAEEIRTKLASFFSTIKEGEFKVYDEYTALGRQKVRFGGYKEESFKARGDKAVCVFTITFKVNDPVTMMKLNDNKTEIVSV